MNRLKIMDFYADWCGPCKMMEPTIKQLQEGMPDVMIEKINVDARQEFAQGMGIHSIPTMIFFVDGEEKARLTGFQTKDKILKKIAQLVD